MLSEDTGGAVREDFLEEVTLSQPWRTYASRPGSGRSERESAAQALRRWGVGGGLECLEQLRAWGSRACDLGQGLFIFTD